MKPEALAAVITLLFGVLWLRRPDRLLALLSIAWAVVERSPRTGGGVALAGGVALLEVQGLSKRFGGFVALAAFLVDELAKLAEVRLLELGRQEGRGPEPGRVGRVVEHLPDDLASQPGVALALHLHQRRDAVLVHEEVVE